MWSQLMSGHEEFGNYFYYLVALLILFFGLTITFIYLYIKKRNELIEYKSNESELIKAAYYDQLTKLPNKLNVNMVVKEQITRCIRHHKSFFTAIVKVDTLNEIYNTEMEKAIIIETANRLSNAVREEDLVAYLLNGSFVIVFNEYLEEINLETIFRRISNSFKKELIVNDKPQKIKISVGLAKYPQNAQTPNELINFATLNRK